MRLGTRAGIFLHEHGLTFVALPARGPVTHFTLPAEENPGGLLRAELQTRKLRPGRVRVGIERSLVTVKTLELPRVAGQDRAAMLRFALERHVPFPADDMVFDARDLAGAKDGPARVLVAAAERRVVDRTLRFLEEPRLRAASITVACHELPRLLRRGAAGRRVAWAHRTGERTVVVFLAGGAVQWSREVPVTTGGELVNAVSTSLPLLRWPDCEAVWVSGDEATRYITTMPDTLGAALSEPPWDPAMAAAIQTLPDDQRAIGTLALGVAAGRRHVGLDLLPEELRPRTWTGAQIATAAMLVLALGSGIAALSVQGYRDQRQVKMLETATRGLESQVKEVERVAADVARKKTMLSAMQSAEQGGLRALPLLRELTELLPQDAWLSQLNADLRGVELVGQANAASQLIPLLEASGWLERAEFTSPVTRGRDREQFRLRAGWEAGPSGPPASRGDAPRADARPDAPRSAAERAAPVERPGAAAGAERTAGSGGARVRGAGPPVPGAVPPGGGDGPAVVNPPAPVPPDAVPLRPGDVDPSIRRSGRERR
jgi:Tfp pilus assembly protein PilN